MPRRQPDLLAKLEQDVFDRTVPLADLLRECLVLSRHTAAAQLRAWATAELKGYGRTGVPEYRKIAAPILQAIEVPYRDTTTRVLNVRSLPEGIRGHFSEIVPLNQSVDELEGLVGQCEAQQRQLELAVFGGDALMAVWNGNPARSYSIVAMYWSIAPAVVRGVLGRVRTALTEFVVELLTEVGSSDQLSSADQTDEALRAAVPSTVFNHSTVTLMTTQDGDIMRRGGRTTIKNNKTKIQDVKGNLAVASAHVA